MLFYLFNPAVCLDNPTLFGFWTILFCVRLCVHERHRCVWVGVGWSGSFKLRNVPQTYKRSLLLSLINVIL